MKAKELKASARQSLKGKVFKTFMLTFLYFLSYIIFYFALTLGILAISVFAGENILLIGLPCMLLAFLVFIIVSESFKFGWNKSIVKVSRNEDERLVGFFKNSFKSILKVTGVIYHTFLKLLLPYFILVTGNVLYDFTTQITLQLLGSIMVIVGGVWAIAKELLFTLNYFVLADEPNLSAKEIVEKSADLMKGNRLNYIKLILSFFGWALLTGLIFVVITLIFSAILTGVNTLILLSLVFATLCGYVQIAVVKFYEDLSGITKKETTQE